MKLLDLQKNKCETKEKVGAVKEEIVEKSKEGADLNILEVEAEAVLEEEKIEKESRREQEKQHRNRE